MRLLPLPTSEIRHLTSAALILVAPLTTALAQRDLTDIPDPDPAVQLAAFAPAEGLEINLFAVDPVITNPTQMNWDAEGRLWVACSPLYPHLKPGQVPDDRIVVVHDTDGDGESDWHRTFATGLAMPTAVMPADGGCYVANSTEVLFLKDTDGDWEADEKTVVLSGFGTEDTHHLLHTFRHGPGGQTWFNQSIYIHSHVETPHGIRRLMGGGVWAFQPRGRKLEVFAKGLINPWGLEFDQYGNAFATDGAGGEGINFVFPGSVFRTSPGARRIVPGLNKGQPKLCGLEILSGDVMPAGWAGSLITCDFRGNRLNRFVLTEDGSGFASTKQEDPLSSTHRAFRPIDLRVGPDGALYIADWYNPIIQHGEVDFRDPRRDHTHGRIWRLKSKDAAARAMPTIVGAPIPEVVEHLASDWRWDRHFAMRELRDRDPEEAGAALVAFAKDRAEDPPSVASAAWAGAAVGKPELLIPTLLESGSPQLEATALRIAYHFPNALGEGREARRALGRLASSSPPQVRLAAAAYLRQLGEPHDLSLAFRAAEHPVDNNIDFVLESFAHDTSGEWYPLYLDAKADGNPSFTTPEAEAFALRASGLPQATEHLVAMVAEHEFLDPADTFSKAVAIGSGHAPTIDALVAIAVDPAARGSRAAADALVGGARGGAPAPIVELATRLLGSDKPEDQNLGARLAGSWKIGGLIGQLRQLAVGGSDPALDALGSFPNGAEAPRTALSEIVADANVPFGRRARAASAMARSWPGLAATSSAQLIASAPDPNSVGDLIATVMTTKGLPEKVAEALAEQSVPIEVAVAALQNIGSRGGSPALEAALQKAGDVRPMNQQLTPEEMVAMVARVNAEGDPYKGERIYRRAALACVACHAIGPGGSEIGPNLVSMGASAPVDYLIESLLDPNAKIKEGYHTTTVNTKSGGVFVGGLVGEAGGALQIRDAAGTVQNIPLDDVAKTEISPVSMMPPGLTAQLREDEFLHLVRFLSELGKDGDFKTPPNTYVREWLRLGNCNAAQADTLGHLGLRQLAAADTNLPWTAVNSHVNGALPADYLVMMAARHYRLVALQFQAARPPGSAAENLTLRIENPAGITLWNEEGEIEVAEDGTALVPLPADSDTARLAVSFNQGERNGSALRIEVLAE